MGSQTTLELPEDESTKTLGVKWEPGSDKLCFDFASVPEYGAPTKRSILSMVSKHFDPLGITSPVTIRAKIILQELWLLPCGWDDVVPDSIRAKWNLYCNEMVKISSYKISRYAFLPNSVVQLHSFCDASELAYGACIFARSSNSEGQIRVQLIAAKSKVAPLKRLSIPRLELSAAVLAARLYNKVLESLDMPIQSAYFWSDSTVTLEWLRSPPNTWKTFIANRVSEIQTTTQGGKWNHIRGIQNPSDLITRGMKVQDFIQSDLWHHGPSWLRFPSQDWPVSNIEGKHPEEILEKRTLIAAINIKLKPNPIFDRASSFIRLLRVTAYCLRFIASCRRGISVEPVRNTAILTVDELSKTRTILIRLAQEDDFLEEKRDLKNERVVSKHSHLRLLSPFIDTEGILRVGGRLNLSEQPYLVKHPILLPSFHPLTLLVARHYHEQLSHGGGRVTLAAMRQEYWPINGRKVINCIIRKCFRCFRAAPVPATQQTGQLPSQRITPSKPFTVTGVDYAGPVYIKAVHKRAAPTKAYISVFVCFSTKAVHLELVGDLSTPAFLAALRRFISRRGCPSHIHSDNGTNFVGARNELNELYKMLQKEKLSGEITSFCANNNIQWHMIPPKAPHFGGLWEAAVKVAKRQLHRQLGNALLSFENMSTVLTQIEACMNSRPLTPMTENPDDLAILTPAHFLIGSSLSALPDADLAHIPTNRLNHYQYIQQRVQRFWHQWRTEYLVELQKENKRIVPNRAIRPGRMVVLIDEYLAPVKWPLARIEEIHPGKDGLVRVVTLRTSKGILRRPITKICLLPYEEEIASTAAQNPCV